MRTQSNFLQGFVNWLEARRIINLLLVFAYFIFIFLMHVPCAKLSVFTEHFFTLPVYNKVVIGVCIVLLTIYLALIYMQFKKHTDNRLHKIIYLLLCLFFIILHFNIMFEMNIEIIHVFQYSILAFLLFPLTRRFGAAVCFAIPFMLVDEWNQYINLYPGFVQYFEFNDVILDINGCAMAVITLYIAGVRGAENMKPLWKRPEFILLFLGGIITAVAVQTCFISLYAADKCANTWLVLNIVPEAPTFWRKFPGRDVVYHIMQPLEAMISIGVLAFFYFGLDSFRSETK
jgi:hypothetical protein